MFCIRAAGLRPGAIIVVALVVFALQQCSGVHGASGRFQAWNRPKKPFDKSVRHFENYTDTRSPTISSSDEESASATAALLASRTATSTQTKSPSAEQSLSRSGSNDPTFTYTAPSESLNPSPTRTVAPTQTASFTVTPPPTPTPSASDDPTSSRSLTPSGAATSSMTVTPAFSLASRSLSPTPSWPLKRPTARVVAPTNPLLISGDVFRSAVVQERSLVIRLAGAVFDLSGAAKVGSDGIRACLTVSPSTAATAVVDASERFVNDTAMEIGLVLPHLPDFHQTTAVAFNVSVSAECLLGRFPPIPRSFAFVIITSATPLVLSEQGEMAVQGLASVLSLPSAFFASPAMTLRVSTVSSALQVAHCNQHHLRNGSALPFFSYPLASALGPEADWGCYVGAMVMNQVLLLALFFIGSVIVVWNAHHHQHSVASASARLRFPSVLVPLWLKLLQPTFSATFVVLYFGGVVQRIVGGIALGTLVAPIIYVTHLSTVMFGGEWEPRLCAAARAYVAADDVTDDEEVVEEERSLTFFIGTGKWIDDDIASLSNIGFVNRWLALFSSCREGMQWYVVLEMVFGVGYGAIAARLPLPGQCEGQNIAFLAVCGAEMFAHLVFRPHDASYQNWFVGGLIGIQSLGMLFSILYHTDRAGGWALSVGISLLLVCDVLVALHFVLQLVLVFVWRFVYHRSSVAPSGPLDVTATERQKALLREERQELRRERSANRLRALDRRTSGGADSPSGSAIELRESTASAKDDERSRSSAGRLVVPEWRSGDPYLGNAVGVAGVVGGAGPWVPHGPPSSPFPPLPYWSGVARPASPLGLKRSASEGSREEASEAAEELASFDRDFDRAHERPQSRY